MKPAETAKKLTLMGNAVFYAAFSLVRAADVI